MVIPYDVWCDFCCKPLSHSSLLYCQAYKWWDKDYIIMSWISSWCRHCVLWTSQKSLWYRGWGIWFMSVKSGCPALVFDQICIHPLPLSPKKYMSEFGHIWMLPFRFWPYLDASPFRFWADLDASPSDFGHIWMLPLLVRSGCFPLQISCRSRCFPFRFWLDLDASPSDFGHIWMLPHFGHIWMLRFWPYLDAAPSDFG